MTLVHNNCPFSHCITSDTAETSYAPCWLIVALMIIVAGGALFLCNSLSDMQDWSWLRDGSLNTDMRMVVAISGLLEVCLLSVLFCCQSESDFTHLQYSALPQYIGHAKQKVVRLPSEVEIYFHDPRDPSWGGVRTIYQTSIPPIEPARITEKEKTFADLYKKIRPDSPIPIENWYFMVQKAQRDGNCVWQRVRNEDLISRYLPFSRLWLLRTDWDLSSNMLF